LSDCVETKKNVVVNRAKKGNDLADGRMLRLNLDVLEDLELYAEFSLQNVEDLGCVLNLSLCQPNFILVFCLFALSEANLIVLKYSVELFSHIVL
jgi:hypothetical protein